MSKSKFDTSKESGPHWKLHTLIGNWDGNTRTWFEKDVLADESPMEAKITAVLGDRFIRYEYKGSVQGKPFEGIMIWGFDLDNNKCQCSWVDSFHMGTGIMLSEGEENKKGFWVLGSYGSLDYPEHWGWRTELEIMNSEQFLIRAFNISPDGVEAKATESIYYRK